VTVCSSKRIDDDKLEEYLNANPIKFPTEDAKLKAQTFINALASASYDSMDEFPLGMEGNIMPDEYLEIISNLKWSFNPEISSGTIVKLIIQTVVTGV
jgi:hypothetical protein